MSLREKEIDALLEEILVDANGEDEQLWAFRQAIEDEVDLPADAFVVGEPVSLELVDYDGNERRGLVARCRRDDGSTHEVSFADVVLDARHSGAIYVAAYRKWLGLEPVPRRPQPSSRPERKHKAKEEDVDLAKPMDLVVMSVKESAARCRLLGSGRVITLRSSGVWSLVPGEVATVRARKTWRFSGHPYISGDVVGSRLDIPALGLTPLALQDQGIWDPAEEYWGEDGPTEAWARTIIARGPRPEFEMEQVIPGADPRDWDTDPICEAAELASAKQYGPARELLMRELDADLRCLDAHAHLGNLDFDRLPEDAIRHYEVGARIGELSLPAGFDGLLPWGHVDNRPFLRCLHGLGLCLWRLDRRKDAQELFERMLWLNPSDNQGIRFLLPRIRAGEPWEATRDA